MDDQERIGGKGSSYGQWDGFDGHAMDASIAVNAASDVLVGFDAVPYLSSAGHMGYLGAHYVFQSHSDCQEEFVRYQYAQGMGVFPRDTYIPPGYPGNAWTGDYSGTQVDPKDDTGFISSAEYAGAQFGIYYYWKQAIALVKPIAPPQPTFIKYKQLETECTSPTQDCTAKVTAPSVSQDGDLFVVVISAGLDPSPLNFASAWTKLPMVNQSGSKVLYANDSCGTAYSSWVLANNFEGTPGTTSWNFSVPQNGSNCHSGAISEIGAFLLDYRNTCQNVTNPFNGNSNVTVYGYNPYGDSKTVSTDQVTAPDNITLLDIFQAGGDELSEDSGACTVYSAISGSPALSVETGRTACDGTQMLGADLYTDTQAGLSYGGYSTSMEYSEPNLGWHVFVPPW